VQTPIFWVLYIMFVLVAAGGLMATAQLAPIAKHWTEVSAIMKAAGETFLGGTGSTDVYDKANDQINALFTNG